MYPQRRAVRLLLALALALICLPGLASAAPPGQTDPSGPAAADSGVLAAATPAYGGVYRPGSWLPVRVDLENNGVDRSVEVRVGLREGVQYAAQLDLPNGGRKSVTVYVYLSGASRRLALRVIGGAEELISQSLDLHPTGGRARVVGLVSGGAPLPLPPRLPDGSPLTGVPLAPTELPEHPLGLSTFDTLVLEDVATADLSQGQLAAIEQWVLRGGQLLLGGGLGLERSLAGLPSPMRPASVSTVDSVPVMSLLGSADEGAPDLPLARLAPQPGLDGRAPYTVPVAGLGGDESSLLLEQNYGRGAVSLFALPLAHPSLLGWAGRDQLWADLLRLPALLPNGFAPDGVSSDGLVEGNLASTLTGLPALEFPPMLALGALLAAYILIVGPGVYLLLRRLDRQALGWVVVPLVTLIFAGLAYGLGYAQRGGDVVVNQVTLVEDLNSAGRSRVRSFAGLFSPSHMSYNLNAADITESGMPLLLRPISLQGVWDPGVGGSSAGGVFVQEGAAGSQALAFEVAQWSMRAVATDVIGNYAGVESRVTLEGKTLRGEVTNRSDRTLVDVSLVQGDKVLRLGDIPPGESRSGELVRRSNAGTGPFGGGTPLSYVIYGEEMDRSSRNGGQPLPTEIQLRLRLLDALFSYGPTPRDGQPMLIAWSRDHALDLSPAGQKVERQHLALITAQPRVELADAAVDLPQGWLAPRIDGGQNNICFGSLGIGVTVGPQPVVMQLILPRDLYGLRVNELALITGTDGAWLSENVIELYDWSSGEWVQQPVQGKPLVIPEPERFLGGHGRIQVRVSSTLAQPSFGCVYVDATLKGSMP